MFGPQQYVNKINFHKTANIIKHALPTVLYNLVQVLGCLANVIQSTTQ
jgi:hypothetical protein